MLLSELITKMENLMTSVGNMPVEGVEKMVHVMTDGMHSLHFNPPAAPDHPESSEPDASVPEPEVAPSENRA